MPAASQAFALIRVPRGQSRPSEEQLRAALKADRESINQPASQAQLQSRDTHRFVPKPPETDPPARFWSAIPSMAHRAER